MTAQSKGSRKVTTQTWYKYGLLASSLQLLRVQASSEAALIKPYNSCYNQPASTTIMHMRASCIRSSLPAVP